MTEHHKEFSRVVAGLKASVHNPNVSDEARQHAIERLKEMGQDVESLEEPSHTRRAKSPSKHKEASHPHTRRTKTPEETSTRVLAGYKATISNPNTSEEAKRHAEEVLKAAGIYEKDPDHTEEQHQTRVLAGYKAALRNPRVSDEAKQHAQEYLTEHGVEV